MPNKHPRVQGPTISPVFTPANGGGAAAEHGFHAVTICVPKKKLYASVKALRKVSVVSLGWLMTLTGFYPAADALGSCQRESRRSHDAC